MLNKFIAENGALYEIIWKVW